MSVEERHLSVLNWQMKEDSFCLLAINISIHFDRHVEVTLSTIHVVLYFLVKHWKSARKLSIRGGRGAPRSSPPEDDGCHRMWAAIAQKGWPKGGNHDQTERAKTLNPHGPVHFRAHLAAPSGHSGHFPSFSCSLQNIPSFAFFKRKIINSRPSHFKMNDSVDLLLQQIK